MRPGPPRPAEELRCPRRPSSGPTPPTSSPRSCASGSWCSTAPWAPRSSATAPTRPATAASASPTGPATSIGNNDLLTLTQPDIIAGIHREYLEAGADVIETNTFNANAISLSDYGLEELAYELNYEAARLARRVADAATARTPGPAALRRGRARSRPPARRRSPPTSTTPAPATSPTTSSSTAYLEAARGLVDGGADLLFIETIFDTLNAKAAIFAVETLFEEHGRRWPVIISGTITDASGRTLSGQVTEAFWNSVRHARPLAVGLNCALGAKEMRPYIAEMSPARRHLRLLLPQRRAPQRLR